ncbi:ABC transporter permease [Iamia majanohamensis]|uniref:ABC transporter permease n=1 Tax=Iamia majanohamensis TaxID=467976 RepID=A0AAE9YAB9_9ACTN|nr:ABC transporter permease [Iamia majanohamensis]WCO67483.1 ABC transporter permease [Iamia majanohamensis]
MSTVLESTAGSRSQGEEPEGTEAEEPEATSPDEVTSGTGNLALIVTPVIIVVLSGLLAFYVSSSEKGFSERSALDWDTKLYPQLMQHIRLTAVSTMLVLLIAIPLGILLTRPIFRKDAPKAGGRELPGFLGKPVQYLSPTALAFASIGQALPAYGLFILIFGAATAGYIPTLWQGFPGFAFPDVPFIDFPFIDVPLVNGFMGPGNSALISPAVISLTIFALLPVLRNTMVGIEQVDPAVIEAGRGMGMSRLQALRRIELPLAVPVILAGIRTALVINVGMATLAFLIGGGALGVTINSGLKLSRDLVTVTGAGMAALLALTVDWIAALVERFLRPKGL